VSLVRPVDVEHAVRSPGATTVPKAVEPLNLPDVIVPISLTMSCPLTRSTIVLYAKVLEVASLQSRILDDDPDLRRSRQLDVNEGIVLETVADPVQSGTADTQGLRMSFIEVEVVAGVSVSPGE
jgi:hypothetical protein